MTGPQKIQDPTDSSGRGFLLVIIAIFVIGAGAVAFVATNRSSDLDASGIPRDRDIPSVAPVTVDGTALEPMPQGVLVTDASTDNSIGAVAPSITGTDYSDETVSITPDGRGKVVMFLAHWCPHCQREVPAVVDLIEAGNLPEGVDVYAVSTAVDDGAGNYPPNIWLAREVWTAPVIRDSAANDALLAYGAGGFPYVVYLDGDNRVIARSAGELSEGQILELWNRLAA